MKRSDHRFPIVPTRDGAWLLPADIPVARGKLSLAPQGIGLVLLLGALLVTGCGSGSEKPQSDTAKAPQTETDRAREQAKQAPAEQERVPASERYEGFATGGDVANATIAGAKRTFVDGNVLQLVFRDKVAARTRYEICHTSTRGASCTTATTGAIGAPSIAPPKLPNTDYIGEHNVTWAVDGKTVARFKYVYGVENEGPGRPGSEDSGGSPDGKRRCGQVTTTGKTTLGVEIEQGGVGCGVARLTIKRSAETEGPSDQRHRGIGSAPGWNCLPGSDTYDAASSFSCTRGSVVVVGVIPGSQAQP